jgi:hypothetical protein
MLEELGNKADLNLIDEMNERLSQTPMIQDLEPVLDSKADKRDVDAYISAMSS